jgi:acetyltransferase-like isoleucine patch superfamily enzyme
VRGLAVIGAGKFAVEVSRYVDDMTSAGLSGFRIEQYLSVPGEAVHAPVAQCIALEAYELPAGTRVVLALSDTTLRRGVIDGLIEKHGLIAENIVHPSSWIDAAQIVGVGNIIGPSCYFGANVTLGSFNVVNYHCTVGHHSRIGSNNFIAPNFHCGNSVAIGDDNFFGLSCTVGPDVAIGSDSRFQAGITLLEDTTSGHSYLAANRIKSIPYAKEKRP